MREVKDIRQSSMMMSISALLCPVSLGDKLCVSISLTIAGCWLPSRCKQRNHN